MELGNVAQQVVDLHLFLFDRPVHPELFRHYADYRVEQGRYHAQVWIVGLSHVVTVTRGNQSMTELTSNESELLPQRGQIMRFRLKGERDHERKCPNGWNYLVSSQVEVMNDHLYKSVHGDLERHAKKRGWIYRFPQWADDDLVPFTYISHDARDKELHIYAYHAFPAECTIVKTQSIFEFEPRESPDEE